ncbi:MAG: hypothetical protein KA072_14680 [Thermoanaerobaculaceae bacterium]|nr:hypothetical protein [Thermoanaerobaculaceae bacterium]MDI9621986.1 hypothetical protein [Acidobacteriota bacterium]NLH10567.1 hypothetical protein [Holophagae bacterium]HPW55507.1 hypothetical protein [Thermoanaerobaculaceae bacterium]
MAEAAGLDPPFFDALVGQRSRWPALLPAALGLLTGLNLCPSFVTVLMPAAGPGGLGRSLVFFRAVFAGTSLFLVPLPLFG